MSKLLKLSLYKNIIESHSIAELVRYDWDKVAYGFSEGDIIELPLDKIKIQYTDMDNVIDYDMGKYFNHISVSELPPIEVSYDGNNFYLEDGHHRYGYYKELGLNVIPSVIHIKANPFDKLGFYIDDIVNYKNSLSNQHITESIFMENTKSRYELKRDMISGITDISKTMGN